MVGVSHVWLLISHLTVIYPLYVGYNQNIKKWVHLMLSLSLTSIISTIYHLADLPNIDKSNFTFLGIEYDVYKNLDFFGSYFSIFLTIFSIIHFNMAFDYQNSLIVLISFFSCFFSVTNVQWYFFILFSSIFSFISSFFITEFSVIKFFKLLMKFRFYPLLGITTLSLSILMQYFFALYYDTSNYPIYHGFWHFFIFLSAGFWMKWNNIIIKYEDEKDYN